MLAVSLDGTHALAGHAGLAEQPAQARKRMLHHALAGTLERVVALEKQEMSAGRECAPACREQTAERLMGRSPQTIEKHGIEGAPEAREVARSERIAARGQERHGSAGPRARPWTVQAARTGGSERGWRTPRP